MAGVALIHVPRLRGLVQVANLRATVAQSVSAAVVETPNGTAVITNIRANAEIIWQAAKANTLWVRQRGGVHWRNLKIAHISFVPAVQLLGDVVGLTGGLFWQIQAQHGDFAEVAENVLFDVASLLVDTAPTGEALSFDFVRDTFTETATVADAIGLTPSHTRSDAFSVSDSSYRDAGLGRQDAISAIEVLAYAAQKLLSDTAAPNETVAFAIAKAFTDAVSASDLFFLSGDGANQFDISAASDQAILDVGRAQQDIVTFLEVFSASISIAIGSRSTLNALPLGEWKLGD